MGTSYVEAVEAVGVDILLTR